MKQHTLGIVRSERSRVQQLYSPSLDDILVESSTFEEHMHALRTVNGKKCKWCKSRLTFTGRVCDGTGLQANAQYIAKLCDFRDQHHEAVVESDGNV